MKLLLHEIFNKTRKFEVSETSPACPFSNSSIKAQTSMVYLLTNDDKENLKFQDKETGSSVIFSTTYMM